MIFRKSECEDHPLFDAKGCERCNAMIDCSSEMVLDMANAGFTPREMFLICNMAQSMLVDQYLSGDVPGEHT